MRLDKDTPVEVRMTFWRPARKKPYYSVIRVIRFGQLQRELARQIAEHDTPDAPVGGYQFSISPGAKGNLQ